MYVVPTGYNIRASVSAIDEELKLSQEQPQKDGHPAAPALGSVPEFGEPNRVTPVATSEGEPVGTPTPTANRANPVAPTPLDKTVATGATDDLPQSNVIMIPWTPGVVRYAAMQLVAKNWERLAVHVECAGDTPVAKLAQFKRGMSKHGVTEVHADQPHCLFIYFSSCSRG